MQEPTIHSQQENEKKTESNHTFKWSGSDYANNSTPQADRNLAALKLFGLVGGENGLDIGCGNARTTRQIAETIYPGEMIGIDKSESMIRKAKDDTANVPNLKVMEGDATSFRFFKSFDFVTSFFCLQWVPTNQLFDALKNIHNHLKENGRVCILLPCYDFTHKVIKGVAFSEKWAPYFEGFKDAQTFFPEDFYRNIFQQIGFQNIDITTVPSNHSLSDEGFIEYTRQWCGCYPWLKDENLRNEFIQDILARLAKEKHENGKLNMVQESIRIIARKTSFDLTEKEQDQSLQAVMK